MIEKRWKLTGCIAALLLGLLAARPAVATGTVCSVDWDDDETFSSADLDGDGMVDGVDLGMLLAQWGACPRCASDFNGDGLVNCVDEEYLVGNWGECPVTGVGCDDVSLLKNSLDPCTTASSWDELPEGYPAEFPSFDVNNDGIVDGDDLDLVTCVLGSPWPPGNFPPIDFNGNRQVDGVDLAEVMAAFGAICHDLDQNGKIGWPDVYVLIRRWP